MTTELIAWLALGFIGAVISGYMLCKGIWKGDWSDYDGWQNDAAERNKLKGGHNEQAK